MTAQVPAQLDSRHDGFLLDINHRAYQSKVTFAASQLVQSGFWLFPDALAVVTKASNAHIP